MISCTMARFFRRTGAALLLSVLASAPGPAFAAFDAPDPTFGENGVAKFTFGTPASISVLQLAISAALDSQKRIYVLGYSSQDSNGDLVTTGIVRLTPNGSVDTTYGVNGFQAIPRFVFSDGSRLNYWRIAVDRGDQHVYLGITVAGSIFVARASLAGVLDANYGNQGIATFNFTTLTPQSDGELLVQTDGKVIYTGVATNGSPYAVRFDTQGRADTTYGISGLAQGSVTPFNWQVEATRPFLYGDGRLRTLYREAGSGSNGFPADAVATRFSVRGVEQQKILLRSSSGYSGFEMGVAKPDASIVLLARRRVSGEDRYSLNAYDRDGAIITNFGTDGVLQVSLEPQIGMLGAPIPLGGPVLLFGYAKDAVRYAAVERIAGSSALGSSQPDAPQNLVAEAGDRQVRLSWQASSASAFYQVFQGTASGGQSSQPVLAGVSGTEATISGLTNDTTYFFTIRATDESGISTPSNEVFATPRAALPAPPSNLRAEAGNGLVRLSWSAVVGAASYNIYSGTSPGFLTGVPVQTGAQSTEAIVSGLTNGTRYYFVVRAVNPSGEGSSSNEANATPMAPPLLAAPSIFQADPDNQSVQLAWTAVSGASGYNVYRGTAPGFALGAPALSGVAGTQVTVTGLSNGTTYYFVVKAVDGTTPGVASNEISATPVRPPPTTPGDLSASPGDGFIRLNWAPAVNADSYNVYAGDSAAAIGDIPIRSQIVGTTITLTGLNNGQVYFFVVRAVNATGTSEASNLASGTPARAVTPTPTPAANSGGGAASVLTIFVFLTGVGVRCRRRLAGGYSSRIRR